GSSLPAARSPGSPIAASSSSRPQSRAVSSPRDGTRFGNCLASPSLWPDLPRDPRTVESDAALSDRGPRRRPLRPAELSGTIFVSSILLSLIERPHAGGRQLDAIQAGSRRHVQRLAVITPIAVSRCLRRFDRAQALSVGRKHRHAARSCAIQVPLRIHFHAVRETILFFR